MSAPRLLLAAIGVAVLGAAGWMLTSSLTSSTAPSAAIDALSQDAAVLAPALGTFDQDGLVVELGARGPEDARVLPWQDADIRFTVTSGVGGPPLRGLQPLAWLLRRDEGESSLDRTACKRKIRALTAGRLSINSEVNLNEYHLVTLDDNASLSIIDPQVGSSLTKTLGMVPLPSRGNDFVLAKDRRTVVVTLPGTGSVALADLRSRRARYLNVEGKPRSIALQPDGRYAWATLESSARLVVVDVVKRELSASVDISASAPGMTRVAGLAFRADSRFAFVAGDEALVVIDVHTLKPVATIDVGDDVIAIAASPHSGQVYVARRDGAVLVYDDESHARVARIDLASGVSGLAASPDGRWLFALGVGDSVSIIDTSTDALRSTLSTDPQPVALTFTESFAYVLHGGSEHALLVDLSTLSLDAPPVVSRVVVGRAPPSGTTPEAPITAPLPEGGGLLVLNVPDRSVYHLMEGMSAPMGSYRTYPWPARGLLLVDNTLREARPGVYVSRFRAPRPGDYTVAFLVPRDPQIYGCLDLVVEPAPGAVPGAPEHELRVSELAVQAFRPGEPQRVELRLTDANGAGVEVDDLMVLLMQAPRWQWRGAATPRGEGRYEVDVHIPSPGPYVSLVAIPSRKIAFGDLASISFTVSSNHRADAPAVPQEEE